MYNRMAGMMGVLLLMSPLHLCFSLPFMLFIIYLLLQTELSRDFHHSVSVYNGAHKLDYLPQTDTLGPI